MGTTICEDELKRDRNLGAAVIAVIVASVTVTILAAGAQANDRQRLVLDCAFEPSAATRTPDAVSRRPGTCGTTALAALAGSTSRYGVPEASEVLDRTAAPEPMAPTF